MFDFPMIIIIIAIIVITVEKAALLFLQHRGNVQQVTCDINGLMFSEKTIDIVNRTAKECSQGNSPIRTTGSFIDTALAYEDSNAELLENRILTICRGEERDK